MNDFDYIEYKTVILVAPPANYLKLLAGYGKEMPEGLTSSAQTFFQKAKCLYKTQKDKTQGEREMAELVRAYELDEQTEAQCHEITQLWPRIEGPARDYAHSEGTPEGDALYASVFRTPKDWRLKHERGL